MASVKLVNGNPHHLHHHSLYHHHHHPFLHHPLPLVVSPPSPSPVAPGHPSLTDATTTATTTAAAGMTLDYSLPNRSRLGDADRQVESTLTTTNNTINNVDDISIGHDDDDDTPRRPKTRLSDDDDDCSNSGSDSISRSSSSNINSNNIVKPPPPPSSSSSPHPTSVTAECENPEPQGMLDSRNTPTKKNKRKLSEPRKLRADIDNGNEPDVLPSPQPEGVHSPPDTRSDDSDDEDTRHSPAIKIPKFPSHSHNISNSIPKQSSSTKHKSSRRNKQQLSPPSNNNEHFLSSSSTPPPSASSSSPSSSSSPQITQSTNAGHSHSDTDTSGLRANTSSPPAMPTNGPQHQAPPPFLHPFLSAVPPAAFGLVPGLYLPGQPYPPSALPTAFPGIPLHLQQSYFAAAAAAAAAAQSTGPSSASSPPSSSSTQQPHCSSSSSSTTTPSSSSRTPGTLESSQLYKHRNSSSSHPVILQPPQLHTNHHHLSRKSSHSVSGSGDFGAGGSDGGSSSSGVGKSTTPSLMSRIPQPSLSQLQTSSTSPSSHFQQRAAQSSSSLDNNPINDEDDDDEDDDDEASSSRVHSPEDLSMGGKMSRKHRKNYKNMTRERRVEANARERTRVHTISAAFDALRRAVPSYSYNQKLSKLAILRIACSYIMSLARLTDLDYTSASEHIQRPLTFAECVDMCTNTIQTEGRARRRH